jgi:hypothetical protein
VGLTTKEFGDLKPGVVLVCDYVQGEVEFVRFITINLALCRTIFGHERQITAFKSELEFAFSPKTSKKWEESLWI